MKKKLKVKTIHLNAFILQISDEWITIKSKGGDWEHKARFDTRDYQYIIYLYENEEIDIIGLLCQTLVTARLIFADTSGECVNAMLDMANKYGKANGYIAEEDAEILKEEKYKEELRNDK